MEFDPHEGASRRGVGRQAPGASLLFAMTPRIALGHKLYTAVNSGDTDTLSSMLSEDFVGDLTPGLPNGFGASPYVGRDAMVSDGWGRVSQHLAMGPQADEIL